MALKVTLLAHEVMRGVRENMQVKTITPHRNLQAGTAVYALLYKKGGYQFVATHLFLNLFKYWTTEIIVVF